MDRAETRSGEVLSRAVGARGAQAAFISLLICERDKYLKARSEIHTSRKGASSAAPSPTPPGIWGKQARQTVGTGNKCVTGPSNKLSGLIVSIH